MLRKINFIAIAFLMTTLTAEAGQVMQVKGTKVLISTGGESMQAGQEVYAIDANGKRKALMKITQVRGDKAVADVLKGQAENGMSTRAKGPAAAPTQSSRPQPRVQDVSTDAAAERGTRPRGFMGSLLKRGTGVGFMGGLSQNSMSLTAKKGTASEDISMTGNSFNFVGFYDYDFSKVFTARAHAGLETFDVKGTATNPLVCTNSTDCNASFMYLSGEAHLHYNFMTGKTRAWVGGGFAFLFAMSKSSSVSNLDVSQATNQMIMAEAGADIGLSGGAFVPVAFEYAMFPGSSTVKAGSMILRAGYGWRY